MQQVAASCSLRQASSNREVAGTLAPEQFTPSG